MSEALELAKSAGQLSGLGMLVLLVLYAIDKGWITIRTKGENGEDEVVAGAPQWAKHLLKHYNHDTTHHHEQSHQKLDKLIEVTENLAKGVEKIQLKQEEWEKYGTPVRCLDEIRS